MRTEARQEKQHPAGDSGPAISSADLQSPAFQSTFPLTKRNGDVLMRDLIDQYMLAYTGRDHTRGQRLAFWSAQLGHVSLAEVDDDRIAQALDVLATTRGRYFAGKDAHGARIFKAKFSPLKPATINRYAAALAAQCPQAASGPTV